MLRDRLFLWNHGRRNGLWFSEDIRFRSYAGFFVAQDPFLD